MEGEIITGTQIDSGGEGLIIRIDNETLAKISTDPTSGEISYEGSEPLYQQFKWLKDSAEAGFGDIVVQPKDLIIDLSRNNILGYSMEEVKNAIPLRDYPHAIPEKIKTQFMGRLKGLTEVGLNHRDIYLDNIMVVLEPDEVEGFKVSRLVLIDPRMGGFGMGTTTRVVSWLNIIGKNAFRPYSNTRPVSGKINDFVIFIQTDNVEAAKETLDHHSAVLSSTSLEQRQREGFATDGELLVIANGKMKPGFVDEDKVEGQEVVVQELTTSEKQLTLMEEVLLELQIPPESIRVELKGGMERLVIQVPQKEGAWTEEDFGELVEAELTRQNIEASEGQIYVNWLNYDRLQQETVIRFEMSERD